MSECKVQPARPVVAGVAQHHLYLPFKFVIHPLADSGWIMYGLPCGPQGIDIDTCITRGGNEHPRWQQNVLIA